MSESLQISFKGESFFLGLIEDLTIVADVEAGALASSTIYTVDLVLAGKILGEGKSLVTLLTIACV